MNLLSLVAVFFGGGLGSLARYLISRGFVSAGWVGRFPLSTLLINVLACAVMGVVVYLNLKHRHEVGEWKEFWLVGFCGGFSTFSTFSFENWLLYKEGAYTLMGVNILLSVVLCFAIFLLIHRMITV